MFTKGQYFKNLGFISDPFASTNAENEEHLHDYFVNPPYFASLVGDFEAPKSSIVIAPRGFGKTAQKKKMEHLAEEHPESIISIVYDDFPIVGISKVTEIKLEHHLKKIIRHLLVAFLSKMHSNERHIVFDEYERSKILELISKYLTDLTPNEISVSIQSIKGFKGKLYDLWLTASKPINSVVNLILKAQQLGSVDLNFNNPSRKFENLPQLDDVIFIENLFSKLGITSVYILVDKVDENNLTTNDSLASYTLIKSLLRELKLLERPIIVFKFFLWDKLTEHWVDDIRLDRIEDFKLEWNEKQIRTMINRRLDVLSNNKITNLHQILNCDSITLDLIFEFTQNSPRDLINILRTIFDVHINNCDSIASIPSTASIYEGIDKFCENKFKEIVTDSIQQSRLKRIKRPTFTIPLLANDIFKENENKIRSIIMPWTRSGIVLTLPNRVKVSKGKLPVNMYIINDLRVARYVCFNQPLSEFVTNNIFKCGECNQPIVFDKKNDFNLNEFNCPKCQNLIHVREL